MPREAIKLGEPETLPSGKVRWKKMVKGNRWRSKAYDQDSRRNRSAAWQEFLEWRQGRQEEKIEENPLEGLRQTVGDILADLRNHATAQGDHKTGNEYAELLQMLPDASPEQLKSTMGTLIEEKDAVSSRLTPTKTSELSAVILAERFITQTETRSRTGQISTSRYTKLKIGATDFVEWFGKKRSLATLTEEDISGYYNYLSERINEKGENPNTIKDTWDNARTFLAAASEDYPEVPTPGNLRSNRLRFVRTAADKEVWTLGEFQTLYDLASDRTKLYLLLTLNCGWTQADYSELTANQVRWDTGRVIRVRSKKAKLLKAKKVAKTNWLLWDKTFELLKQEGNQSGLVLTNENGSPILTRAIVNGNEKKSDNVASAWKRAVKKAKNRKLLPADWKKTLDHLRDTGSEKIKTGPYALMYDAYLDHNTANLFYGGNDPPPVPEFDKAIRWLGEQFGYPTNR